jgi:hypothetical protein
MKTWNRHLLFFLLWANSYLTVSGQMIIKSPKKEMAIEKRKILVTIAGKPGARTWLYINNAPADSGHIRIDGKYDFLNVDVPEGPVEIRTEAEGAGNRIYQATRNVHIVGRPDTLIAETHKIELPADGKSTETVQITVQDAWGYPINRVKVATVHISMGSLVETDMDSLTSGSQVPVSESRFQFGIRSAGSVGHENVTVEVGEARLNIPVRYTTPLTKLILVGSLDAATALAQSGDRGTEPKFTLADWTHQEGELGDVPVSGRLAFYAKGSMMRKYQVTASYDSRRNRDNQLFRDLDPDQQYALYGDASTLIYDAKTQSKFYGKIERNESFIQMGDFNTEFRSTEFAKYDRSFTGLISHLHWGRHQMKAFATLNNRSMQMDEIRGEGISGYYYLSASRITLNSDKIRLETRDRYHPEQIIESEEKTRYIDYDINYMDGTLMFKQPVPAVDASGNPVTIVALYEYETGTAQSLISGIRMEGNYNRVRLGSTVIIEEKEPSDYVLAGTDVVVSPLKGIQLKGELVQTRNTEFSQDRKIGNAYSAELDIKPVKVFQVNGYYRKVDSYFLNPSLTGSRFELGTEKYGTLNTFNLGKYGKIQSETYRQLSEAGTVNEYHVQVINAFYEYPISKKTSAKIGYQDAERNIVGQDTLKVPAYRSKMIKAQIGHQWSPRFTTELSHEQNLAEGKTTLPTGSTLGVSYAVTEKVKLFLKQRLLQSEKRKTQTILGVDSKINNSTEVSGKYEIGGAAGEALNRATIGLRNKWEVRKDLTLNFSFESTSTMDSLEVPTPEHNAVSAGFEYLPDRPWKSSGKFELMQDKISRKRIISLGSEYKFSGGLSVIGRFEHAGAVYLKSRHEIWNRGQTQLGIAWRPENHDVFNGIAKLQLLTDKNTHVAPETHLDRLIIASHGYWQVSSRIELGLRFALRQLLDEEFDFFRTKTRTALYAVHGEFQLNPRWMAGLDLRVVHLTPVNQMKSGASAELGYCFKTNMVAGLGYVFKQLDDADFSFMNTTYSNFYLVLRMKFSEDIFDWR